VDVEGGWSGGHQETKGDLTSSTKCIDGAKVALKGFEKLL
jgi:hypothetical protein